MLKKKKYKILVFLLVLATLINVSLSFEGLVNGHFLLFSGEAKAATWYHYDKYTAVYDLQQEGPGYVQLWNYCDTSSGTNPIFTYYESYTIDSITGTIIGVNPESGSLVSNVSPLYKYFFLDTNKIIYFNYFSGSTIIGD